MVTFLVVLAPHNPTARVFVGFPPIASLMGLLWQ